MYHNYLFVFLLQIGGNVARYSVTGSAKKKANNNSEELIQKIWGSVRSNNGIMVYKIILSKRMIIMNNFNKFLYFLY